ncbi:MAG: NUDIX hydrolase [Bacteroidota bacterium]
MLTIYFNELAIYFTDKKKLTVAKSIFVANNMEIVEIVKKLRNNEFDSDILLHGYDENSMFEDFRLSYIYIEAAGGVVKNKKSEFLLIKRFDIWDLPKGKIEKGETPHEAAVREVCEETGLQQVEITSTLPSTYHIYEQKGRWFLKKTYWYSMKTNDDRKLIPQLNEAITDAVWMNKEDASTSLSKSYRSLFDTLGYTFI